MTAVPAGHVEYRPFVISVAQPNCGKFYVTLSNSGMVEGREDHGFYFTAVSEQ
jgi:hypothetical protein